MTTDEPYDDVILGYLQNQSSLEAENYLKRGRHLKDVETGILKERWIELYRELFGARDDTRRTEREDVNAELSLRGEDIPFEAIAVEVEALRGDISAERERLKNGEPVRFSELHREIALDIEKFRGQLKKPKN